MNKRDPSQGRARRSLAPLLMLMLGFSLTIGIVVAVAGQDDSTPSVAGDEHSSPLSRKLVASGTDTEFGRWRLYSSVNAKGEQCVGLNRPDAYKNSGLPPEAFPKHPKFEGEFEESCGPTITQMVEVYGKHRTLVYGDVPEEVESADLVVSGKPQKLGLSKDPRGTAHKFFVGVIAQHNPTDFEVVGKKANGDVAFRHKGGGH